MKKILYILITISLITCQKQNLEQANKLDKKQASKEYKQGFSIIKCDENLSSLLEESSKNNKIHTRSMSVNNVFDEIGVESHERLFTIGGEFEQRQRKFGLHKWYKLYYDKNYPRTRAEKDLYSIKGILKVEKPIPMKPTALPNDKHFKMQWNLYNIGSLGEPFHVGCDINVVPVWNKYTTGSENVIVAVIDTGVDIEHPDLKDNCITDPSQIRNFVDRNSTIIPMAHGTHVAGIISAVRNNKIGVAGIAGGDSKAGVKGVKLLNLQIFKPGPTPQDDNESADGSDALVWAADHGAVIANNSWGYNYKLEEDAKQLHQNLTTDASYFCDAVDYFIKNAGCDNNGNQLPNSPMKGGIVIFAAGNENRQYGPPANYDKIVAVGSIGPNYQRAPYSNYGTIVDDWVDISAPGGASGLLYDNYTVSEIPSTGLSTTAKTSYVYMEGTSMATPHVSGVAALLVSHYGGPNFTADELKEKLLKGANSKVINNVDKKIGPLVSANGSFSLENYYPPEKIENYLINYEAGKLNYSFDIPKDPDDVKPSYAVLCAATKKEIMQNLDPMYLDGVKGLALTQTYDLTDYKQGERVILSLDKIPAGQRYYTTIFTYDKNNFYSPLADVKSIEIINHKPSIKQEISDKIIYINENDLVIDLKDYFEDIDKDKLLYKITNQDTFAEKLDFKFTNEDKLFIKGLKVGLYQLELIAKDIALEKTGILFRIFVGDKNNPLMLYPNPAQDEVKIRGLKTYEAQITIYTQTGSKIYETKSVISAFKPISLDITKISTGIYNVRIKYDSKIYTKQLVKI